MKVFTSIEMIIGHFAFFVIIMNSFCCGEGRIGIFELRYRSVLRHTPSAVDHLAVTPTYRAEMLATEA